MSERRKLLERIERLEAENAELRAQVERLSAPVSDEEWDLYSEIAVLNGYEAPDMFIYRNEINALLSARRKP